MSYYLSIHKVNSDHSLQAPLYIMKLKNEHEANSALNCASSHMNMAGFCKWSVIPIRTDIQFIAQDLFLPTLINGVIRTNRVANIGFMLLALIWDFATLPIRFFTLPFRAINNLYVESNEHPILFYLRHGGGGINPSSKDDPWVGELGIRVYKEEYEQKGVIRSKDDIVKREGEERIVYLTDKETPYLPTAAQLSTTLTAYETEKIQMQAKMFDQRYNNIWAPADTY